MTVEFPFVASALTAVVTALLCFNANSIAAILGIMDIPDERKRHRVVTPLMGGVAVQLAFVPIAAIAIITGPRSPWMQSLLVWLLCIVVMTLVGLADDRHTLSARDRLLLSFLAFASAAILDPLLNVRILSFEHPGFQLGLGASWFAVVFTMICCVGLVNAVNMADGKNGLVIGLCLGWVALLASRAPDALLPMLAQLATILVVLMVFNLRGRLFLGDGGAYGLASAIGMLAIMIYNSPGSHAGRAISADELMLLFAVPVIDAFRLTFARAQRGQSPMAADRDHLHHHLQDRFGWPAGLLVYLSISLFPSLIIFGLF